MVREAEADLGRFEKFVQGSMDNFRLAFISRKVLLYIYYFV